MTIRRLLLVAMLCFIPICVHAYWHSVQQVSVSSAPAYVGPGDLGITNVAFWGGFRCYSTSYTGSVADIWDSATGSTTHTLLTCSSGGILNETINPLATTCASGCVVAGLYDQSGQTRCTSSVACDWTQATNSKRPAYTASASGSGKGCMTYLTGSSQTLNSTNWTTTSGQPIAISLYAKRTGSANFQAGFGASANGFQLQWTNSANVMVLNAGSTSATVAVTDNAFHALQALYSGASSSLRVDSTPNTGLNPSTGGINTANVTAVGSAGAANFFNGVICEVGGWLQSMSTGDQAALASNQAAFY